MCTAPPNYLLNISTCYVQNEVERLRFVVEVGAIQLIIVSLESEINGKKELYLLS